MSLFDDVTFNPISIWDFSEELRYLNNEIRMLNDTYPNAYIKTFGNKKFYIIDSKL